MHLSGWAWLSLFLAAQQTAARHGGISFSSRGLREGTPATAAHTSGERLGIGATLVQCLLTGQWLRRCTQQNRAWRPERRALTPSDTPKTFVHSAWDTTPIRVCRTKTMFVFLGWLGIDKEQGSRTIVQMKKDEIFFNQFQCPLRFIFITHNWAPIGYCRCLLYP